MRQPTDILGVDELTLSVLQWGAGEDADGEKALRWAPTQQQHRRKGRRGGDRSRGRDEEEDPAAQQRQSEQQQG